MKQKSFQLMQWGLVYICFIFFNANTFAQTKNYFPAKHNWEKRTPSSFNINTLQLEEAVQFAIDNETKYPKNLWLSQAMQFGKEPFSDPVGPMSDRGPSAGLIIYKGYIIAEWGALNSVEMCNSVTKSWVSTSVGLAFDKGLLSSVNDPVYSYLPPVELAPTNGAVALNPMERESFIYPFNSLHNKKITWDHLLRQTSDWEGVLWGKPDWADRPSDKPAEWLTRKRNEPGTVFKYNDTRVNALALAATLVWRKPLPEVFKEQIMDPIGASNSWLWTGYQNAWIVLDGKMIQSVSGGGHFGGGLFINAYDMARFGLLTLRKGNWEGKQLLSENWINQSLLPTSANKGYGYMNYFLNTDRKMYPSAPASAFAHIGNGTNMIYVDKENDLVIVTRWIEDKMIDGFLSKVFMALPKK